MFRPGPFLRIHSFGKGCGEAEVKINCREAVVDEMEKFEELGPVKRMAVGFE